MNNIKEIIRKTNIQVLNSKHNTSVVGFASLGNTHSQQTIIANMGIMYSHANEKVIILDADFENQTLKNTFKLNSKNGLAEYLDSANMSLNSITNHIENQTLDIITSGLKMSKNDYLVDDPRFNVMIKELREKYDLVIINTPVLSKNDHHENLWSSMDGILLIIDKGIKKRVVNWLMKSLDKKRVNVLGYIYVE